MSDSGVRAQRRRVLSEWLLATYLALASSSVEPSPRAEWGDRFRPVAMLVVGEPTPWWAGAGDLERGGS